MLKKIIEKIISRKFWFAAAAFLSSLGSGISGVALGDADFAKFGFACTVLSAAIYCGAEAYTDGKSIMANVTQTVKSVTATTSTNKTAEAIAGVDTSSKSSKTNDTEVKNG